MSEDKLREGNPINYIASFDTVVDEDFCSDIKDLFNAHEENWQDVDEDMAKFKQLNIVESNFSQVDVLLPIFQKAFEVYRESLQITYQWPNEDALGLEEFKLRKFSKDDEGWEPHVDVGTQESCTRYLGLVLALDGGANMTFVNTPVDIELTPGKLIMFPSVWTFPYKITKPDNDLHLIYSFLKYK